MNYWICQDFEKCPYPCCYAQEAESKKLREEWESQRAMTQKEIEQEQLELTFAKKQQELGGEFAKVLSVNYEDLLA